MNTETTRPRMASAYVRAAMHSGVITCDRAARLSEVAATMARERVHSVVVEDGDGDGVWGIVSDLDLVAAATVRDLEDQSAAGTAVSPVVRVTPSETLERAAQLMTEHGTSHLMVVDEQSGRPVGMLSTLDIATMLAEGA